MPPCTIASASLSLAAHTPPHRAARFYLQAGDLRAFMPLDVGAYLGFAVTIEVGHEGHVPLEGGQVDDEGRGVHLFERSAGQGKVVVHLQGLPVGVLLEGVGHLEQRGVVEALAYEHQTHREPVGLPAGDA